MRALKNLIRGALYRYGWDTRCRNLVSARAVRATLAARSPVPQTSPALLDVGCGELGGLAAFLPGVKVMGVDLAPPAKPIENFTFKTGDITALPFSDRSFPVVSCIDVLEHLPLEARNRATRELLRVAECAVLIACPHG